MSHQDTITVMIRRLTKNTYKDQDTDDQDRFDQDTNNQYKFDQDTNYQDINDQDINDHD